MLASHRWLRPSGCVVCAWGQQCRATWAGSAHGRPVTSPKALSSLACTRASSSCRCSADQAGLACTVQRSTVPPPGLDDSRASQAMRWWVLRHVPLGASVVSPAARPGVGQSQRPAGAMATPTGAWSKVQSMAGLTSNACAAVAGWLNSTASNPAYTCWEPSAPWVRNCQPGVQAVTLHALRVC